MSSELASRTLLVIDRATGETERIPCTDANAIASIANGANSAGLSLSQAVSMLVDGNELVTNGYLRRLA